MVRRTVIHYAYIIQRYDFRFGLPSKVSLFYSQDSENLVTTTTYRISCNRMNSRVLIWRVQTPLHPKTYGTPFIRRSFFFRSSFQFHLRVHFSLVGPLLLLRLHILPREFYNQSHQASPFVNVLNLFAHIPFNPEPNFN